jgi:hypothetical protein
VSKCKKWVTILKQCLIWNSIDLLQRYLVNETIKEAVFLSINAINSILSSMNGFNFLKIVYEFISFSSWAHLTSTVGGVCKFHELKILRQFSPLTTLLHKIKPHQFALLNIWLYIRWRENTNKHQIRQRKILCNDEPFRTSQHYFDKIFSHPVGLFLRFIAHRNFAALYRKKKSYKTNLTRFWNMFRLLTLLTLWTQLNWLHTYAVFLSLSVSVSILLQFALQNKHKLSMFTHIAVHKSKNKTNILFEIIRQLKLKD